VKLIFRLYIIFINVVRLKFPNHKFYIDLKNKQIKLHKSKKEIIPEFLNGTPTGVINY